MSSKKIFEEDGVSDVSREKQCKILKALVAFMFLANLPSLRIYYKVKCTLWAKYMKTDCSTVI